MSFDRTRHIQRSENVGWGVLNEKSQEWWLRSLNELGDALKTSFKLKANPFKKPQTADEWEPYLAEKQRDYARMSDQLAAAEAEINDRVAIENSSS